MGRNTPANHESIWAAVQDAIRRLVGAYIRTVEDQMTPLPGKVNLLFGALVFLGAMVILFRTVAERLLAGLIVTIGPVKLALPVPTNQQMFFDYLTWLSVIVFMLACPFAFLDYRARRRKKP